MSSTIFQLTSYDDGFVSQVGTGRTLNNAFAIAVGDVIPFGEWSDYISFGDVKVRYKAGIQEWKFINDVPVYVKWDNRYVTIAGDFCQIKHDHYFSDYLVPENLKNDDICHYCGHSNGASSELRNGWDCCYCGGN